MEYTLVTMSLSVGIVGIRSGEYIIGPNDAKQTKGALMQVRVEKQSSSQTLIFPPLQDFLNNTEYVTLRDETAYVPFFGRMLPKDRVQWIKTHAIYEHPYLEDLEKIQLRVLQVSDFIRETLSEDNIHLLSDSSRWWDVQDIFHMFPRRPGSKAEKHTLILRPGNWNLYVPQANVAYTGVYVDVDKGLRSGKISATLVFETERIPTGRVGIVAATANRKKPGWNEVSALATVPEVCSEIKKYIDWFPPALHKSLLQKIIRTGCSKVRMISGEVYNADDVLQCCLLLLMLHPGSFVPNIQQFVSGMESATKRLAVSILEDSSVSEKNEWVLCTLFAAAEVAKVNRSWFPLESTITTWLQLAVEARRSRRCYKYDTHEACVVKNVNTPFGMCWVLLSDLKSFEADINLVACVANNNGELKKSRTIDLTGLCDDDIMPIEHCIDHHTFTTVAHFFDNSDEANNSLLDYSEVFRLIWNSTTGVNSRKSWFTPDDNTRKTREAQALVWKLHTVKKQQLPALAGGKYTCVYTLSDDWLAGLLGPIQVTAGGILCVLKDREFLVVKKPARNAKQQPVVTDKERQHAIKTATEVLQRGVQIHGVSKALPFLEGATIYFSNDEFYITVPGSDTSVEWSEFRKIRVEKQLTDSEIVPTVENAILYTGDYVQKGSIRIVKRLLRKYSKHVLDRLSMYLRGTKDVITLHKISRDGGSTEYNVSPYDTQVNELLCKLSVVYPAMLEITPAGFVVKNGPMLWCFRKKLGKILNRTSTNSSSWTITPDTRHLWEHQIDSVRVLMDRTISGHPVNLIWIPVGMGKTLIVLRYMYELLLKNLLPAMCVYTLPPSAIDSVSQEFLSYGMKPRVVNMNKTGKIKNQTKKTLKMYRVNLVEHDQLRKMTGQLTEHANQMFFVVDEFHKTMNKTQRTSVALEVSTLARICVGMSGTIIKDTNYKDLIAWLSLAVEFNVTEKNYWVAIGALVSKKVSTKVVVKRSYIEAEVDQEYKKYVPAKLGGTARFIDFQKALQLSYFSVEKKMLTMIKKYITRGEGVFVIARNNDHQKRLVENLQAKGIEVYAITKNTPITLTPKDTNGKKGKIQVVVTTKQHSEGYTLTKFRVKISGVWFSNQATRDQLEGRLNRIGQPSDTVYDVTVHAGILTYVMKRYESSRNLSEALKGFADDIGVDTKDVRKFA